MSENALPVVTIVDGAVTTLSTDVAAFFEKNHRDVLRAIENIVETLPENRLRNFAQTEVARPSPLHQGAVIKSKAYRLTRDGFTFLAMGFTGEKAQAFKWAYIDAFNKMEAALRQRPAQQLPPAVLTEQEACTIMSEVSKRAKENGEHYQTIYRALKARYKVTKFTNIPREKFEDAVQFIRNVDLRVPEKAPEPPKTTRRYTVSADFLERQRIFVYYVRYLFRKEIDLLIETMSLMGSPHAGMLWDAIHDLNLIALEKNLESLGFPVKDLDCYKHWEAKQAPV